jgi:pentatricopeptide repeat protein
MTTSYPSATTLRAVVRQFRKFLKASAQQVKAEAASRTGGIRHSLKVELPRARIWAQTIRGLIWLKQYRRARVAIHAMQKLGIRPTGFAWRGICRGWIEQGELARAEALAVKVFTRPEISHDYKLEERPYYFTDMQQSGESEAGAYAAAASNGSRPAGGLAARRKHRSPMSPNSAPLFLVIEALAECGEMERARHWFDQIPEHEMTDLLTSDMVAGYLKVGQQDKAQEMIRIMARCGVKPTAIVFNPIVEHAVQHMNMEAAEELVQDMTRLGIYSNLFTYKILIQGYIAAGQKDKALECLDRIKASGVETDRALGRILLEGLWQLGELREGDQGPVAICDTNRGEQQQQDIQGDPRMAALDFVEEPGWSQRCIAWIQDGKFEQAEEVLHHVLSLETVVDPRIQVEAVQVVRALADRQEMTRARHWLDQLIRPECVAVLQRGANSSGLQELMDHMVSGYIQTHRPTDAEDVIGIMSQQGIYPTVDTINLILRWSTLQAEMEDAEGLVQKMAHSGISPNQETFEILCLGYASRGDLMPLQECLTRMEEAGFAGLGGDSPLASELRERMLGHHQSSPTETRELSSPSGGVFATMCAQWIGQDQMSRAEQFVGHLLSNPHVQPEMIPYATLIEGWISQSQQNPVSISALQAMNSSGKARSGNRTKDPNAASDVAANNPSSSSVPSSESLHHEIQLCEENISKMRKARYWFDRTPNEARTVDLLNKMVGGYMALGLEQESESMIQWMAAHKIKPNVDTYNHILEHTIQHLTMPTAEGLVQRMRKGGIAPSVETWNLLVRGYVIRGLLGKALECLDRMAESSKVGASSSLEAKGTGVGKSKAREIIEVYDREILDVVVHTEEEGEEGQSTTIDTDRLVQEVTTPNDTITHTNIGQQQQPQEQDDNATAMLSQSIATTTKTTTVTTETTTQTQRKGNSSSRSSTAKGVEPNALTKQLILSGFGPELKPPQGQGDYARALELYRNRVARQKDQEDQLLKGVASLRMTGQAVHVEEEDEDEDGWILDHLESFQGLSDSSSPEGVAGSAMVAGSGVGMTDVDWKNELQWEELMEMEKGRERELSGR